MEEEAEWLVRDVTAEGDVTCMRDSVALLALKMEAGTMHQGTREASRNWEGSSADIQQGNRVLSPTATRS